MNITSCSPTNKASEAVAAGATPGMQNKYTSTNSHAAWRGRVQMVDVFMTTYYGIDPFLCKM